MPKSIQQPRVRKISLRQKLDAIDLAAACPEIARTAALAVFVKIVWRINSNNDHSWPSYERLARDLRISRVGVLRAVDLLERFGFLTVDRSGRSNLYFIGPNGLTGVTNRERPNGLTGDTGSVSPKLPKMVSPTIPEHSNSNIKREHMFKSGSSSEKNIAGLTFEEWVSSLNGAAPIPADHNLRFCAAELGISNKFVEIAWVDFRQRYAEDARHRSTDWPNVFHKFLNEHGDAQGTQDASEMIDVDKIHSACAPNVDGSAPGQYGAAKGE